MQGSNGGECWLGDGREEEKRHSPARPRQADRPTAPIRQKPKKKTREIRERLAPCPVLSWQRTPPREPTIRTAPEAVSSSKKKMREY